MTLKVTYYEIDGNDDVTFDHSFKSSVEAEQFIQDTFCNEPEEYKENTLHIRDKDNNSLVEYSIDDFDC